MSRICSSARCSAIGPDFLDLLGLDHRHRALHEVADHRVHVAADVADLGELGRLDLDERRVGEVGEPAGDLGLADAGRADHQDVLGDDLVAQVLGELPAAIAVAQRDRDRLLGLVLADDVLVQLRDDLLRSQFLLLFQCAPLLQVIGSGRQGIGE